MTASREEWTVEAATAKVVSALGSAFEPVALHVKELEEEVETNEQIISELHTKIEKLQKTLVPRDPRETAGIIHDFFYLRGGCPAHWKFADSQLRTDLIALVERLFGTDDVY